MSGASQTVSKSDNSSIPENESLLRPCGLRLGMDIGSGAAVLGGRGLAQARWIRVQNQCGQATKGVWGMSRRWKMMKGVEDCEKPGEAVKQALIPGCPNRPTVNP